MSRQFNKRQPCENDSLTPFELIVINMPHGTDYKVRMYDSLMKRDIMVYEIDQPMFPERQTEQYNTYTLLSKDFSTDGHKTLLDAIMDSGDFIRAGDHVFGFKLSNLLQVKFNDTMHYDVKGKLIRGTAKQVLGIICGSVETVCGR